MLHNIPAHTHTHTHSITSASTLALTYVNTDAHGTNGTEGLYSLRKAHLVCTYGHKNVYINTPMQRRIYYRKTRIHTQAQRLKHAHNRMRHTCTHIYIYFFHIGLSTQSIGLYRTPSDRASSRPAVFGDVNKSKLNVDGPCE